MKMSEFKVNGAVAICALLGFIVVGHLVGLDIDSHTVANATGALTTCILFIFTGER